MSGRTCSSILFVDLVGLACKRCPPNHVSWCKVHGFACRFQRNTMRSHSLEPCAPVVTSFIVWNSVFEKNCLPEVGRSVATSWEMVGPYALVRSDFFSMFVYEVVQYASQKFTASFVQVIVPSFDSKPTFCSQKGRKLKWVVLQHCQSYAFLCWDAHADLSEFSLFVSCWHWATGRVFCVKLDSLSPCSKPYKLQFKPVNPLSHVG